MPETTSDILFYYIVFIYLLVNKVDHFYLQYGLVVGPPVVIRDVD